MDDLSLDTPFPDFDDTFMKLARRTRGDWVQLASNTELIARYVQWEIELWPL